MLIVDPSAAAYGSNENNRALVRAFVSDLDAWARDNNCAVLILSHPPKWAADYSGSTDWEASVRSMWTLRKEGVGPAPQGKGKSVPDSQPEGWQLARPKANYGPPVPSVQLDWDASGGGLSPNPPKDTDGRREDSGRGWVRELQGRWPGVLG